MKTNKFKAILFCASIAALFCGCTKDDDFEIQEFTPMVFAEDFNGGTVLDNTVLDTPGWTNYAEAGTVKWKEQVYSHNAYAEFSSFQSGELSNIGWLISPPINMDAHEGEKLVFQTAQAYVSSGANSLEVLVSTDFDGTNVTAANWQPVEATLPLTSSPYFAFLNSGEVDLSSYTGNLYLAFKVKGSGTNTALDGSYQVDNIRIIY